MLNPRQAKYQEEISKRLINLCFTQASYTPRYALPATLMPILFLWQHIDHRIIFIWLAIVWAVYLIVFPGIFYIYKKLNYEEHQPLIKLLLFLLPIFAGGSWGLSSLLLFDGTSFFQQNVLLAYIIGIASVTAIVYTSYHPYFLVSSTSMLGPFIFKYISINEFTHYVITIYLIFFLLALHVLNKKNNRNLTEMLYLQLSFQEQKDIAETAKQAQTNFFAAASHDLRQPLHVQGLLASTLRNKLKDPEQIKTLDMLEQSMKGVQNLLNALLDFSKLDAGALQPETRPFNLRELVERLFLQIEPQAAVNNLTFAIRTNDVIVNTDELLLERILRNLVNNAIQYTQSGGSVLLATRQRRDKVIIEVRDSGPGIPEHEHQLIFQEFRQTESKFIRNSPGLGLGLAIVKRLSVLLNIDMGLRSAPGRGSTFYLILPISTLVPENPPMDLEQIQNRIAVKKILLVDDNQMILQSMGQLLEDWGCQVLTAQNGEQALNAVEDFIPDLAIIDYRLEGETGLEIYNKLSRELNLKLPVIIMTGDTAADKILELQDKRLVVVHKPVPVEKLHDLVVSVSRLH